MQSGKLNKRIVISKLVEGSPRADDLGQPCTAPGVVCTVWASIEPLVGREFWAQQQVQSEITVKIRVRYRADLLPGMTATYAAKIYTIKTIIDPQEYHKELQLMCAEGVING